MAPLSALISKNVMRIFSLEMYIFVSSWTNFHQETQVPSKKDGLGNERVA